MIRLDDTSGSAVAAAIASERHRQGSPTTGMVLTMLILTDEEHQADATAAAVTAARQHPMRIVTLIPRPGKGEPRLDAEIAVGGDDGPGEVAVLRLRGVLSEHANSVAIPLLLSDTPVVAYWPANAPECPAEDLIGRHAQRRITDCSTALDPLAELARRRRGYRPGDTDLSWTRITPWRSLIASLFDQEIAKVDSGTIRAESLNASAELLRTWLADGLSTNVQVIETPGIGISAVRILTTDGDLSIERPDGITAELHLPGSADSQVALPRRDLAELLTEELRRLDPDEVYEATLMGCA